MGGKIPGSRKKINRGIVVGVILVLLGVLGFIIIPAFFNVPPNIMSSCFRLKIMGPQIIPSILYYPVAKKMTSLNEYLLTLNPAGTSLGNKEITKATLVGPREKLEVQAAWPDLKERSSLKIILPGEKSEDGKVTLDLSTGIHNFTHLQVEYINGEREQFFIGNLFWEIISPDQVTVAENSNGYYLWCFSEASLNPFYLVYFQNNTGRNLTLTGLHIPDEVPYTLDLGSFSFEKGVKDWRPYPEYSDAHPWPYKVISQKNTLFPSPINLVPGEGVTLFFSLAPTSDEAGKMLKNIGIALETNDDQVLLPNSEYLDGLENWSLPELSFMLWRP